MELTYVQMDGLNEAISLICESSDHSKETEESEFSAWGFLLLF